MRTKKLGRTGFEVSTVGLGTATIGLKHPNLIFQAYDGTDSRWLGYSDSLMGASCVQAAIRGGCTLVDTAPKYLTGEAESMIAIAMNGQSSGILVTTKIGVLYDQDGYDFSYDAAMRCFEGSLRRLDLDTMPLVYLHDPMGQERKQVEQGVLRAMQSLRDQRGIQYIGIAANDPGTNADWIETGIFDAAVVPDCWSVLDQRAAKRIVPAARKYGVGLVAATVVERGLLATGPVIGRAYLGRDFSPECFAHVARVQKFCAEWNLPLGAVALQWPTRDDLPANRIFASAIPGARTPAEATQNALWGSIEIPAEFWAEFDRLELARQMI